MTKMTEDELELLENLGSWDDALFPGCRSYTAIMDFPDEKCGEEIDLPARSVAEARERVRQMVDMFYNHDLTVVRAIGLTADLVGTIVIFR